MKHVRILVALIVAVLLQWSLRHPVPFSGFIDFPLIVIVYVALQRESLRAMLYATLAGVAVDSLSGGLLGASGFSKTLTAFIIAEFARRVLIVDNHLLKIPVLAGASLLEDAIYIALNRLLGSLPNSPLLETLLYTMIGTTVTGTFLLLVYETVFSERARAARRNATPRRQPARRNPIRLGRRY